MSNKGRRPDKDELKLWDTIKKSVCPMRNDGVIPDFIVDDKPKTIKPKSLPVPPAIKVSISKPPLQAPNLDRRTENKLRKGKMPVEAILDMHGMTQEQAHNALKGFVTRAYDQQKRCVLVITGKGLRSGGQGVLKGRLPIWLGLEPLNHMVLQCVSAHKKHGGDGAFYLYLKRIRPRD